MKLFGKVVVIGAIICVLAAIGESETDNTIPTETTVEVSATTTQQKQEVEVTSKEQLEKRKAELLSTMRVEEDEFEGMIKYCDKDSIDDTQSTGFYAYVTKNKDTDWELYLHVQYYGDAWLMLDKLSFKAGDLAFDVTPYVFDMETDIENFKFAESFDAKVSSSLRKNLNKLASMDSAQSRYYGSNEGPVDVEVSSEELKALARTLELYDILKDLEN